MLYAELIMCDVIIYDISESPEQMEEAILVVARRLLTEVDLFCLLSYLLSIILNLYRQIP